jgi:hypothetical protein
MPLFQSKFLYNLAFENDAFSKPIFSRPFLLDFFVIVNFLWFLMSSKFKIKQYGFQKIILVKKMIWSKKYFALVSKVERISSQVKKPSFEKQTVKISRISHPSLELVHRK